MTAIGLDIVQDAARSAISSLRSMVGNNYDGHLSVGECMVINNAIAALESYYLLYPNAIMIAIKAREDAEYNANLFYTLENKVQP